MGTKEKLIERFKRQPNDFTFDELERIHKPHPGNILKGYAMKQVLEELKKAGHIK